MMMLQRKLEECIDSMWETFGEDTENHKVLLKTFQEQDKSFTIHRATKTELMNSNAFFFSSQLFLSFTTRY